MLARSVLMCPFNAALAAAVLAGCTFEVNMPWSLDAAGHDEGAGDLRGEGPEPDGVVEDRIGGDSLDGETDGDAGTDAGTDETSVEVVQPDCVTDADCKTGGEPDPCVDRKCDKGTGKCVVTNPEGTPCDDGDLCTTDDYCSDGSCLPGAPQVCPGAVGPCQESYCNPSTGACDFKNQPGPCDDVDACTTGEKCVEGVCGGGKPAGCNDDNLCTKDSCDPATGCKHVKLNDTPDAPKLCNDKDPCTAPDKCHDGVCIGDPKCDDDNVCTEDICTDGQCSHKELPFACGIDCASAGGSCFASPEGASCPPGMTPGEGWCEPGMICCFFGQACAVPEDYASVPIFVLVDEQTASEWHNLNIVTTGTTMEDNIVCYDNPLCLGKPCCNDCTAAVNVQDAGLLLPLKLSFLQPVVGCKGNECDVTSNCTPAVGYLSTVWGQFKAKDVMGNKSPQLVLHGYCQPGVFSETNP